MVSKYEIQSSFCYDTAEVYNIIDYQPQSQWVKLATKSSGKSILTGPQDH